MPALAAANSSIPSVSSILVPHPHSHLPKLLSAQNATETSDLLPSATVESAPTSTAIPDADGSPNAAADPTDDADVTETTLAAPTLATPALAAAQSNGAGRLVGQAPMVPLLALSAIASVVLFGL